MRRLLRCSRWTGEWCTATPLGIDLQIVDIESKLQQTEDVGVKAGRGDSHLEIGQYAEASWIMFETTEEVLHVMNDVVLESTVNADDH